MSPYSLWEIVWDDRAAADLDRLDWQSADRVIAAVERLAMTGHGDVKRLDGMEKVWRLRVGERRVLLVLDEEHETVWVARVKPRGNAYR